ncbi:TPA: hypothetical protein ACGW7B_005516 [Bacillus nitratireducens]
MKKKKVAKKDVKKLSVDIPMSLKRNLDIFCAEENELIKDVVAQAIKQYIQKRSA